MTTKYISDFNLKEFHEKHQRDFKRLGFCLRPKIDETEDQFEKIEFMKSFWILKEDQFDNMIQWFPHEILQDLFTLILPENHRGIAIIMGIPYDRQYYTIYSSNPYVRIHDCLNHYDPEIVKEYFYRYGLKETIHTLKQGMEDDWTKNILIQYVKK
jgi:hypothetical protein